MDAKQIDIVIKLIALANNNPNEHEANSAARRVCVMLKNYQFKTAANKINNPPPPKQQRQESNPWDDPFKGFRPSQAQKDWYAKREWADYETGDPFTDRSTRPGRTPPGSSKDAKQGEKETEPPKAHQDYGQRNKDPFAEYKEAWSGKPEEPDFTRPDTDEYWAKFYDDFLNKKRKEKRESPINATVMSAEELEAFIRHQDYERNINKRDLSCSRCFKSVRTGFPGTPANFVCMQCELKSAKGR